MSEFNLLDEPWIPCVDRDWRQLAYGIRETLLQAHDLREICDGSPLVTAAIHRLLLAILYRANEGPTSFEEWKVLYTRGRFDSATVDSYLDRWQERFDIFSSAHPFYQMANLETRTAVPVRRLATECASGNNATLFNHNDDASEASWTHAEVARQLIACQAFALGFGKSGNATIDGSEERLPYSADAIALRGMNIWLQGASLFETLSINLTPTEDESIPPWELEKPNAYRDRLKGKDRRTVAAIGAIDRLTWQSRLVRLIPDGERVSSIYYTQGRSADKSAGDPMKSYRLNKSDGIVALPLSAGRAAWRDIHSILTIPSARSTGKSPEAFNLIARARDADVLQEAKPFDVHVVGLATAPNKAGKFLLWRHDRMPIHSSLVSDDELIGRLRLLLQNAERAAMEASARTRRLCRFFLAPECESPGGVQPDSKAVSHLIDSLDPRPMYWARLEQHFYSLLECLPKDRDAASRVWRTRIKQEAQSALEESIKMLGTSARAVQAIARVRTTFGDADLEPSDKKTRGVTRKGGKNE